MGGENTKSERDKSGAATESPMAMGMGMAKKMMAQMGHGGSPFEMMQKMMGQMSEAGKPPPMEKMMGMCMGMCSEMLNAIRQTTALAVHATPELENAFGEWLTSLEVKAMALAEHGPRETSDLAATLGISDASANYLLARLAQSGKLTLSAKKKS